MHKHIPGVPKGVLQHKNPPPKTQREHKKALPKRDSLLGGRQRTLNSQDALAQHYDAEASSFERIPVRKIDGGGVK